MKCAACHSPTFRGGGSTPRLAGQKQAYLAYQLDAFGAGRRSHPPGMPVLKDPSDRQKVASYLASLQ
jgi:cytochrome c553